MSSVWKHALADASDRAVRSSCCGSVSGPLCGSFVRLAVRVQSLESVSHMRNCCSCCWSHFVIVKSVRDKLSSVNRRFHAKHKSTLARGFHPGFAKIQATYKSAVGSNVVCVSMFGGVAIIVAK